MFDHNLDVILLLAKVVTELVGMVMTHEVRDGNDFWIVMTWVRDGIDF